MTKSCSQHRWCLLDVGRGGYAQSRKILSNRPSHWTISRHWSVVSCVRCVRCGCWVLGLDSRSGRFPDRESKPSTQHPHRTHDTTDQWRDIRSVARANSADFPASVPGVSRSPVDIGMSCNHVLLIFPMKYQQFRLDMDWTWICYVRVTPIFVESHHFSMSIP